MSKRATNAPSVRTLKRAAMRSAKKHGKQPEPEKATPEDIAKSEESKKSPIQKGTKAEPRVKNNIKIHLDHIEDLDETHREQEKNAREPQPTGLWSHMRIVNRQSRLNLIRRAANAILRHLGFPAEYLEMKWIRRIYLHGRFVRRCVPTHTAWMYKQRGVKQMYMQPCPASWLTHTSVFHIRPRSWRLFRWYGYYADLDMTPEPQSVLMESDLSPMLQSYTFRLQELFVRDEEFGDIYSYRMVTKAQCKKPITQPTNGDR